jgi:hypothetical protein
MNLSKATNELDRLFDIFNEHYYQSKLEKPVIVIQSVGKKPYYGFFTINKLWKDSTNKEFHEITISSEYLNRDIYRICTTLLHEIVHLANDQLGIKDTSANCKYHNKKFKESAELVGLVCKHDAKVGWGITEPTEEFKKYMDTLKVDNSAFSMFRQKILVSKVANPIKYYNYECNCGQQIKSKIETDVLDIVCEKCSTNFHFVESHRGRKKK